MRRLLAISLSIGVLSCILLGCTRDKPADDGKKTVVILDPKIVVQPPVGDNKTNPIKIGDPPIKFAVGDADKQEKYENALAEALTALAERKWNDALVAFETARSFQDSDFVKDEIAKLKQRTDQDNIAKNAVKNIETVLNDGKAEDAAKLARDALAEFGAGDDAPQLIQLRLQAEALQGVQNKEGAEARADRFRTEGEAALKEKNLRAAALAFEQSLLAQDNPGVKVSYEQVREKLDQYDGLRKKAAELRMDPARIEDAIDALKQAAAAWDNLHIRQELDDAMLALQKRRDNVSVVDFEVRNNVGMPDAGSAVADELLPLLKPKYDLVERGQLNKIIGELKLERGFVDDPKQQEQLGRFAKVRYLVVGSIRRSVAVSVQARLIDVQTGLVMQTAKVMAPTMEDALNMVPDLAKQLMMTDDEKMQVQQNVGKAAEVVPDNAAIPPAPLPPAPDAPPPPPLVMANNAPPALEAVKVDAFARLAPAPQVFVPQAAPPPPAAQPRNRLLFAALELGDFHFRAGRFDDAQRKFEFALNLDPNNGDIRLRIERVQAYVPPPALIVQPIFVARPRLAVLTFATYGDPRFVPRSLGHWTPTNLAPYFSSRFDVVDPAEVYWFMDRMGMTMSDLMNDVNARRWLGRAVGVRYFVLGNHVQTTSFDVNTYLIDAEFGYVQGSGRINVQNPYELKLRLPELAEMTMMSPAERAAIAAAQQQQFEAEVIAGRRHMDKFEFDLAIPHFVDALKIRPNSVQVRFYLEDARRQARIFAFQIERRRQFEAQQAAIAAAQRRQWELAQASELARQRAVAEASIRIGADNKVRLDLRVQAQNALVSQAQFALKTKNFGLSVNFFQGAVAFAPPPVVGVPVAAPVLYQDLAQAQMQARRAEELRIAELTAAREAALLQKRNQQLALARQQVIDEREIAQAKLDAVRKAQAARDDKAYTEGFNTGTRLLGEKKYEAALAAFQGAQRLKPTTTVNLMIEQVVSQQAQALAKTQAEKDQVTNRLLVERERRKAAELLAKNNDAQYKLALAAAQQALAAKEYEVAQAKFTEASQIFKTDAVLAGLRQVESARAARVIEAKKADFEKNKAGTIAQLIATGNAALDAKEYGSAVKSFQQAKKLAPDNLDANAGLLRAQQANDRLTAEANRKTEETSRNKNFARLVSSGKESLANKQYHAAVANLSAALKLNPADAEVQAALKQAEKGRDSTMTDTKALAEAKLKAEAYQKKMNEGWLALQSKRYDDAIKAYGEAQKAQPGDKAARDFLQEAESSKKAAADAVALAAKKRVDELKKSAELQKAINQGRTALAANDLATASKLIAQARLLDPNHADVKKASLDLEAAQQRAVAEAEGQKKRLQAFQTLVATGKEALTGKRYPEALKALSSATSMMPGDKEAQDLFRRAQTESRQVEEAAIKLKLQDLLITGMAALKAKNFDAAEKALRSASIVDPTNPAIVQGLKDVEAGRKALANTPKTNPEFQLVMDIGDKAMAGKKYADAIGAYTQASKLDPTNARARQLLLQAQQALMAEQLAQQQQAKYLDAIKSGQSAMNGKKFADAVKAFTNALSLNPTDPQAKLLLQQAQKALDSAGKADAEAAARQAKYQEYMKAGSSAMNGKKYTEAVGAYREALTLMPKDLPATRGLLDAQKALDASKVKTPPPDPKAKAFEQAMQRGAAAEKEKKYAEAVKAFIEANKLRPKDNDAITGWRQNQFNLNMATGQQYLDTFMWAAAQAQFEQALQIMPGNPQATKLLQQARKKMK